MMETQAEKHKVIKKYSNRRLYDTNESCYITIAEIEKYIQKNIDFKVIDAKTQENLTNNILIQIILEKESENFNALPSDFLKQIIQCYGNENLTNFFHASLLEMSKYFSQNQQNFVGKFKEITKKNIDLYQKTIQNTMNMFFKN